MAFDGATENLTVEMTLDTKKLLNQLSQLKNNMQAQINAMQKSLDNINLNALAKSTKQVQSAFNNALTAVAKLQAKINGIKTNITIKTQTQESSNSNSGTADILRSLAIGQAVGQQVGQAIGSSLNINMANGIKNGATTGLTYAEQEASQVIRSVSEKFMAAVKPIVEDLVKRGGKNPLEKMIRPVEAIVPCGDDPECADSVHIDDVYENAILKAKDKIAKQWDSFVEYIQKTFGKKITVKGSVLADLDFSGLENYEKEAEYEADNIYMNLMKYKNIMNQIKTGTTQGLSSLKAQITQPFKFIANKTAIFVDTMRIYAIKLKTDFNDLAWVNNFKKKFSDLTANFRSGFKAGNQYQQGMNKVKKSTDNAKSSVTGLTGALRKLLPFLSIYYIFRKIAQSVKSAMDSIESLSLVSTIFGKNTSAVKEWADTLQNELGISSLEMQKNSATLYNIGTNMGIAGDKALKMSKDLTLLSQDMASFYNITSDEAFEKIKSGLTGQSRPLRDLGIMVDNNTLKEYGYSDSLDNASKVMIRYQAIMAQTGVAQGDLARTIEFVA